MVNDRGSMNGGLPRDVADAKHGVEVASEYIHNCLTNGWQDGSTLGFILAQARFDADRAMLSELSPERMYLDLAAVHIKKLRPYLDRATTTESNSGDTVNTAE